MLDFFFWGVNIAMYSLIIVDDELKIREGLVNLIPWEQNSFQVVGQFSNGKQALEFIKNKQVDVVLTDIRMPIMSGIELSDCLSKEYSDILFVFLTGYQDFSYMHTAIINHAFDYLLKPIKYEALYTCFERLRTKLDEIHHQSSPAVCENSSYYGKIIAEVCSYLDTQYQTATLDTAAAIVNLSPNYLSKLFKDKAKMGFSEYLNEVRMKKAAELLCDISFKHYEIAYRIGYDNPKNFSRAFKQYYNMSPREFREKNIY